MIRKQERHGSAELPSTHLHRDGARTRFDTDDYVRSVGGCFWEDLVNQSSCNLYFTNQCHQEMPFGKVKLSVD